MKIRRFMLFFGIVSVLLVACASAATPASQESSTTAPPIPSPDDDTPVLTWHRAGGIAGFCNDVTIFADGAFKVEDCMGKPSARSGRLNADQQAQLTGWIKTFKSFEEGDDQATAAFPDQMFVKTTFKGAGPTQPSPEDMLAMGNFAATFVVVTQPVGGEYPEAALKARDFLANELNLAVDEIKIVSTQQVEWSDSCLGLGQADEMCAQMITSGYKIILEAQGKSYELRTDASGESIRRVP